MAKFNTKNTQPRPKAVTPIRTSTVPTGRTYQDGPGFRRDSKSELFILGVSYLAGENTYYEWGNQRDKRFVNLVHRVALDDPAWMVNFIHWLRHEGNIRTAPIVAAAEMTAARLKAKVDDRKNPNETGYSRRAIRAAIARADEPAELIAYWFRHFGRSLPKPVKRGIADAVKHIYTEKNVLKWDSREHSIRMGDVINLTHPAPETLIRSILFKHILVRRYNNKADIPLVLEMLRNNLALRNLPVHLRRQILKKDNAAQILQDAGITWEFLAGWLEGPMDKEAWEAVIPSMGVMALLRNLRNFDNAGVSDEVAKMVMNKITSPEDIKRSKVLPMRFLSAYNSVKNSSVRWLWALEQGLNESLNNIPELPGRTLILVDRSGSMFAPMSSRTNLTYADAAAIFGAAIAMRAEKADLVQFGTTAYPVTFKRGHSLLKILKQFNNLGGTYTREAIAAFYKHHDRVLVITDEQAAYHNVLFMPHDFDGDVFTGIVPDHVPCYTWNLGGYRHGHSSSGEGNRHTFGGLTDACFYMVDLVEKGMAGSWPWD